MIVKDGCVAEFDMKRDPRALKGQLVEHHSKQRAGDLIGPNSKLTRRGVRQKSNILNSSSEFIENREPSIEHGSTVNRGLYASWSAVEQSHAQLGFELRDRPGNDRLRNGQMSC